MFASFFCKDQHSLKMDELHIAATRKANLLFELFALVRRLVGFAYERLGGNLRVENGDNLVIE